MNKTNLHNMAAFKNKEMKMWLKHRLLKKHENIFDFCLYLPFRALFLT